MAIKAHAMTMAIDTDAETVTFSMLNRNHIAVVEKTYPLAAALQMLSTVIAVMDEIDMFEDEDEIEEVAGHC